MRAYRLFWFAEFFVFLLISDWALTVRFVRSSNFSRITYSLIAMASIDSLFAFDAFAALLASFWFARQVIIITLSYKLWIESLVSPRIRIFELLLNKLETCRGRVPFPCSSCKSLPVSVPWRYDLASFYQTAAACFQVQSWIPRYYLLFPTILASFTEFRRAYL